MKERSAVLKHGLLLFLLAAALLTVPVLADMGPKPQLTVRVENGPEELYYLDLLEEGEPYPYPDQVPGGLKGNYGEELETLDQDLLAAFTAPCRRAGTPAWPRAIWCGAGLTARTAALHSVTCCQAPSGFCW